MKETWGFTITMKNLPKIKQGYLKADINFFKAKLKFEAWRDLQMFVKSRGKLDELTEKYSLFQGLKFTQSSIQTIETWFDLVAMDDFDIMVFTVTEEGTDTLLNVVFNEDYFKIWDSIKRGSRLYTLAFNNPMTNKEKLLKQFKKQIEEVYTKDYTVVSGLVQKSE